MFETVGDDKKKTLQRTLKKHASRKDVRAIRKLIEIHGGIKYATEQMERISQEAMAELNIFPYSDYKEALCTAVKFNLGRKI
jgi:geranylgeranyl pyrophosphate synthase